MDSRVDLLDRASAAAAYADSLLEHGDQAATVFELRALRLTIAAAITQRDNGDDPPGYEGWADVELMGHRSRIGYIRETRLAGRKMIEIQSLERTADGNRDGSGFDLGATELYSAAAVFSLSPLDEEQARRVAAGRYGYVAVPDEDPGDIPF